MRYRALDAQISHLSQDRQDLKFASMQVCCAMARPTMRDIERVKRIGRYLVGKPRTRRWFRWQQSGDLKAYSDADWGGDKATRRSVSAGGHHERRALQVWTNKQQSLIAVFRRELAVRRSQDRVRRAGDPEHHEGHGNIVRVESALGCFSNNVPGQPQRPRPRRFAEPVDKGGFQSRVIRHEEGRFQLT